MKMVFRVLLLIIVSAGPLFSQDIVATHDIKKGANQNEYTIKTTINGLEGVDIAKITYFISKEHAYQASTNNSLFSNVDDKFIKFYIMAVPASGIINVELGVLLSGEGSFNFPVEFQYSKNEEKKTVNFIPLKINNEPEILANAETIEKSENENEEEAKRIEEERLAKEEELAQAAEEEARKQEEEAKKVEEEQLAKENAALEEKIKKVKEIAEQEEREAQRLKEEEQAKLAEEQARKNEETQKEIAEKAKRETEQAAQKLKEEQLAKENAALEEKIKKVKEIAEQEEREAQRMKEEKLAEATKEEELDTEISEETKREVTTPTTSPETNATKYGVQIFALSRYSEQKVKDFCKKNGISWSEISNYQINGITKIRYGSVKTRAEAEALRKMLLSKPQINGAFIVKLAD